MDSYSLVLAPQPMQPAQLPRLVAVRPDETLASFLEREAGITARHHDAWAVSIGGLDVPPAMWGRMRVKPGQTIEVHALVHGDDARTVVAVIAIAVLTYYTMGTGTTIGGSLFATNATAATVANAAIYVGGQMLIQRYLMPGLVEPNRGGIDQGPPTYSLQGGRNRARAYESMCLVLGETKCVPDYAAQPYTWFEGSDQYMAATFHAGINCATVSQIKLGQTDLSNYADVQILKAGFATGNTDAPLFKPTNVDTSGGLLLDATTEPGDWTVRTTSPNTVRIDLDFEASLYGMGSSGKLKERVLHLEAEYRLAGSSDAWVTLYKTPPYQITVEGHYEGPVGRESPPRVWVPSYTYTYTPVDIELKSSSTTPVRLTATVDMPAPEVDTPENRRYEVRVRKVSANTESKKGSNVVYWQALKSYQKQSTNYEQLPRVQVVIRASGQINGSLDELSWVARSEPLELWDGSSWRMVSEPGSNGTSNPGAQILKVLRGWTRESDGKLLAGGGLPVNRIDLETLKAFMIDCTLNDWRCDLFLQEKNPDIGRLLGLIAACGFGRVSRGRTGRWGVTWMSPDQPHQGTINMAVMKARSFSVHYDLARTADEVQLEYFDAASNYTWQSVRVKVPGVDVPQATYRESMAGIYHHEQAAQQARFKLAQSMFGRRSISFELDLLYR
ncbi:TipJ family phage tail tip protein, partial [Leptospira sp. SA-E8]|uniref:TipJ family phage tail tip protein n=1 Tax=Leptospira sp. SA-E8 TaxID=3422259 RepID=UPI003EC025EA